MREYLELESTPADEDCQQFGNSWDKRLNDIDAECWKNQLRRQFPKMAENIRLKTEYGDYTYRYVAVFYNDNNEEEMEYAFDVENNAPTNWDETAKKEREEMISRLNREE